MKDGKNNWSVKSNHEKRSVEEWWNALDSNDLEDYTHDSLKLMLLKMMSEIIILKAEIERSKENPNA